MPKKMAINRGRKKLILNEKTDPKNISYFSYPPPKIEKVEIYDLETDPNERTNFALSEPDMTRQLLEFMKIHFVQKCEWTSLKTDNKDEIREQLRALGYIK
jgi:hypothetical protein